MTIKIGYVVNTFPRLTLTFTLREILALESMGLEIVVFSLSRPSDKVEHLEFKQMLAPIIYVPSNKRIIKNVSILLSNLFHLLRFPQRCKRIVPFLLKNRSRKLFSDFFRAGWLATQIKALDVDHLHANGADSQTSIAMFAALLSGKSFSFAAHASDIFPRQEYFNKKLDEASFAAAISEYNRRFLISLYGDEIIGRKIHVVHCGVDLEKIPNHFLQSFSFPAKKPTIVTVARLAEQKGHHILVDALSILRNRGYEFSWIVVGSGPQQVALEEMVKTKGLSEFVDFKGDQPSDQVMALMKKSDLCVLPCIRTKNNVMDGIPVALMEAMALGTPVVSTSISGIPELIEDGVSGLLSPPDDAVALADLLEQVFTTPNQLEQLRIAARRKIEQEFSAETNAALLYQLFAKNLSEIKN